MFSKIKNKTFTITTVSDKLYKDGTRVSCARKVVSEKKNGKEKVTGTIVCKRNSKTKRIDLTASSMLSMEFKMDKYEEKLKKELKKESKAATKKRVKKSPKKVVKKKAPKKVVKKKSPKKKVPKKKRKSA